MEKYQRTAHQTKILEAMEKVQANLINFKKQKNTDLVVYKMGKIKYIKP
jgi:hypothetical protein